MFSLAKLYIPRALSFFSEKSYILTASLPGLE